MRPLDEGPIEPGTIEGLVEEYADRIYGIALRITGSPEEAEDATQDTFLQAYEHRASFRGDARPYTWLYRIAVNTALQRVRRLHRTEYLDETGFESVVVTDWTSTVHRQVEMAELHATIEHGLALMPEDLRVALVLRDAEGFSTAEAAEILQLTEPALKSRLHRARALLRQYLSDELQGA